VICSRDFSKFQYPVPNLGNDEYHCHNHILKDGWMFLPFCPSHPFHSPFFRSRYCQGPGESLASFRAIWCFSETCYTDLSISALPPRQSKLFIYLTRGWAHPLDLAGVLPSPESLECRLYKILNMPLTVLIRDF